MKFHPTVIEKLISVYSTYGGFRGEGKLREALVEVDLESYTQQTGLKKTFLVLKEDIERHSNNS